MSDNKKICATLAYRAGLMPRLSYRSLPIALLRARERLMSEFRPMLAGHDVTEQQWRVLRVVSEESSIEFSVAAERTCLQAPSLSRIVATLESKKLIRRERNPHDRRRLFLTITDLGVELIAKVAPESRSIYADLRAKYGDERFEQLLDMLVDLTNLPKSGRDELGTPLK